MNSIFGNGIVAKSAPGFTRSRANLPCSPRAQAKLFDCFRSKAGPAGAKRTPRHVIVPMLLIAASVSGSQAAEPRERNDVVHYQVREGDTLHDLGKRHFWRPADHLIVQRLNRLDNPRNMQAHSVLIIPRSFLRYKTVEARILAFRGKGSIRQGTRSRPVAVGMAVREGDVLNTPANASLSLGFPDNSVVTLPSQSQMRVERLRLLSLTNVVEREFRVLSGQARGLITPMSSPDDVFQFRTPHSISAVRGTQLRVSYSATNARSSTEVLEGKVAVAKETGAAPHMVEPGFGIVSTPGVAGAPTRLLPAPALAQPDRVQDEDQLMFPIQPLSGAVAYRAEISEDAGFLAIESEAKGGPVIAMPTVRDGIWFVRISAIDGKELEGLTKTYSFRRRLLSLQASSERTRSDGFDQYLFRFASQGSGRFQYHFQLFRDGVTEPMIDEPGLGDDKFALTNLPPGDYHWRVGILQFVDGEVHQKWSPNQQLSVVGN